MKPGFSTGKATAYLLFAALQLALAGCQQSDPEAAIEAALAELETAIEDGDTGTVMDRLSDDIILNRHGHGMAGKEIRRMLMGVFLRYPKRQLTLTAVRIDLDPVTLKDARVRFTALAWGGKHTLPDEAESFQVDSHWHRDGEWRIDRLDAQ